MTTDLLRLLDLPAAALLTATGDELTLVTLTHEHADRVVIARRRLGATIDLHELLGLVGSNGLAEAPQIHISEVTAPQLPAPVEEAPDEPFTCLRCDREFKNRHALTTHIAMKHKEEPAGLPCPQCERTFKNQHAREVHQGRAHKAVAATPEPTPEPLPVLIAQSTATSAIPVPVRVASEYICSTCGQSLELHERCADCQALLGPGHEAGTADGHGLCSVCVKYRATAEQLGVAA